MYTTQTTVRPNSKGATIWVQGLAAHGWHGGTLYSTTITPNAIEYRKCTEGKVRKVTASKGGIIDNTSQKVLRWAQGATECNVMVLADTITITRVNT